MQEEHPAPLHEKPFKVIIVGGGLVGVTAAHILSKTDIDFVVLEQHGDLTPRIGANLALWPSTYRILKQLDILDGILPILNDVQESYNIRAADGSLTNIINGFGQMLKKNHGYPLGFTARAMFISALYKRLPELAKARICVERRVIGIELLSDGVCVHCDDGTAEEGAIVIGADGVHSRTRQCMDMLASGEIQGKVDQGIRGPILTTYRALIGQLPAIAGLEPGNFYQSCDYGVGFQVGILGDGRGIWYLFEAVEKPTPGSHRLTEQDKQDMMNKYAHLHAAPGYRLRDIFALSVGGVRIISLEEGKVNSWSWGGRIALVGDAVRKLHPQAGFGYNRGVGDIVELINGLYRLLHPTKGSTEGWKSTGQPTAAMLQIVFDEYEKRRKESEAPVHTVSQSFARTIAWASWGYRVLATWIQPFVPVVRWVVDGLLTPIVAREPVLDWIKEGELPQGASPWLRHPHPNKVDCQ